MTQKLFKLAHFEYLDLYIMFPADCEDISITHLLRDVYREKYSQPLKVFDVEFDDSDKRKNTQKCLIRTEDEIFLFSSKKKMGEWVNENGMPYHGIVKNFCMIESYKDAISEGLRLHEPEEEYMIIKSPQIQGTLTEYLEEQIKEEELDKVERCTHYIIPEGSKDYEEKCYCSYCQYGDRKHVYIIQDHMLRVIASTKGKENRIVKAKELLAHIIIHKSYHDTTEPSKRQKWEDTLKRKLKELQKDFDCNEYAMAYFGKCIEHL